jgi:PAS domain S-box-containing protein
MASPSLIQLFCRATRQFFGVDGTYFWRLVSPAELIGAEADGLMSDGFPGRRLRARESAVAANAIRQHTTVYVSCPDPSLYPLAGEFHARSLMAAPLVVANEVIGAAVFLHASLEDFFTPDMAAKATILAGQLGCLLEANRLAETSREQQRRARLLMELSRELSTHLRLPDFAPNFVNRAADLMGAQAAALAVKQDSALEILSFHGAPLGQTAWPRLTSAITSLLARRAETVVRGPAAELLGADVASALSWADLCLIRLQGPSAELVGVLCLGNIPKPLEPGDEQLLQAIAAHASIALENVRLFSRTERANRHWVEIFDAITDFIVAHDQSDQVLSVNRSLADFIGVEPRALIGLKMWGLLSTDGASPVDACPFCRSRPGDASDEYVLPMLDRVYLISTSRVHAANSEGLQTVHVLKDITDRREAERRYRELFDNIQEGLFFSTTEGRFIEVNDALVRMLGYSSRDALLLADIPSQIFFSPQHFDDFTLQMVKNGAVRNHEQTLRRRDGTPVFVLVNAFAARDEHQRMVQYRGVMLDISGIRSFQSELQRERDFSDKILNNTQSLILVADTGGLISYANRRWYEMGYQQNQLLGKLLEDLVAQPRRPALAHAFAATLAGQQVDNLELLIMRDEGRVGQFSANISPVRDDQGRVASIVVVMSDVTDRATLQAKLMQAEKLAAVGELVSGVAHEVNNPLTAVLGFADLLMDNPDIPENARKDLRVILQEAQRTKQIVQNLLSFARQMPPQRKLVQINAILRRTVQLRAYDFHSRGVEVIEQLEEALHQVMGDAHQLQTVFLNILNNAYDAMRDTGRPARMALHTTNLGSMVEVTFRDNGQGIKHPDRIFDPFFTTKDIGKGTGLGLSICYGIVREHGGEITCHNNPDGEGATFIVRLPAAAEVVSIGAAAGVTQP